MVRVQLDLPEERVNELDQIMQETGLSTRKDLINQALTLFQWALRERQAGRMIGSVDEANQRYKELSMPALEHGAKAPSESKKNVAAF